jgi:hypothetical protein
MRSPNRDAAYWEIEKLLVQALRADANTLECLWSPLHKKVTPLGEKLLSIRDAFISINGLGSFGRYAESQFKKIDRSERFLRERGVATSTAGPKREITSVYRWHIFLPPANSFRGSVPGSSEWTRGRHL